MPCKHPKTEEDCLLRLGRIEGKIDLLVGMEQRLRALELAKAWIVGVAAGAGALASVTLNWLFRQPS